MVDFLLQATPIASTPTVRECCVLAFLVSKDYSSWEEGWLEFGPSFLPGATSRGCFRREYSAIDSFLPVPADSILDYFAHSLEGALLLVDRHYTSYSGFGMIPSNSAAVLLSERIDVVGTGSLVVRRRAAAPTLGEEGICGVGDIDFAAGGKVGIVPTQGVLEVSVAVEKDDRRFPDFLPLAPATIAAR